MIRAACTSLCPAPGLASAATLAALVFTLLGTGCQGDRQRPLSAAPPLAITDDVDRTTVSLDTAQVPVLPSCAPGQLVQKTATGWACVPGGQDTQALRDQLQALTDRVRRLERGPTYSATARSCAAEDPGGNLAWVGDCAISRGVDAQAVILRCPVVVTSVGEAPATDGIPAWKRLTLYGDDTGAPPEASTATFELFAEGPGGILADLQPVMGTQLPVTGVRTEVLSSIATSRLMEGRVTLVTTAAGPPPARFCGFGLGPE